jgi:protein subunit release factor B
MACLIVFASLTILLSPPIIAYAGIIMFNISPEKEEALRARMESLGIFERDIEEKFVRSGGKGGQNVNKVATCVYLKHLPTGVEVKCQEERSQSLNRFLARRILAEKIERMIQGRISEEERRIAKIRRQKRRRSKRAKEKMLEAKHRQSEKKQSRAYRPSGDEL